MTAPSPAPVLSARVSVPPEAREGATVAVLLHGRGSHQGDLQGLGEHLPPGTILVTPQAPFAAAAWGYGPGWAWYRHLHDDRVDGDTLRSSLAALDGFLDRLPGSLPLTPGGLVLGGFSQGGTTSLAWALTRPGRVQGVLVFSGFLVDDPGILVTPVVSSGLRVFWGHGTEDPAIAHALAVRGRERLRRAGAEVEVHDYAMGHTIAPRELADARAWMVAGGEQL